MFYVINITDMNNYKPYYSSVLFSYDAYDVSNLCKLNNQIVLNYIISIYDDCDNSVEEFSLFDIVKYIDMGISIRGITRRKSKHKQREGEKVFDVYINISRPSFSQFIRFEGYERVTDKTGRFNHYFTEMYKIPSKVEYIMHSNKLYFLDGNSLCSSTVIRQQTQERLHGDKLYILDENAYLFDGVGSGNKVILADSIRKTGDLVNIEVDTIVDLIRYYNNYKYYFLGIRIKDNILVMDTLTCRYVYSFSKDLLILITKMRLAGIKF